MRNHDLEFQDTQERIYAYNFDYIMHQYMMRTFEPWIKPGKALEMGCYKGDFTNLISQHYQDITVIEAASELISIAKENTKKNNTTINFLNSTFENVQIDQKFDAIFLIHTLEHIDDSVSILKKINNWLSADGKLFLAVPNANAASRQIAVKMGLIPFNNAVTEGEWSHGHRRTYSFDTLELEAKKAGLKIKKSGGIFFKAVANFQLDLMLKHSIINQQYLDGCYELGMQYPELCSSIYLICEKGFSE